MSLYQYLDIDTNIPDQSMSSVALPMHIILPNAGSQATSAGK